MGDLILERRRQRSRDKSLEGREGADEREECCGPSGPEVPQLSIGSVIITNMDTVLASGMRMQSAES